MTRILLCGSAVRVHDSQACGKMAVTRDRISCILELREMLLSFQTGFNLVNDAVVRVSVCTTFEVPDIFPEVIGAFYILMLSTLAVFLISLFVHFRESLNRRSASTPHWYTSHRYSVSPTGCPPTLEFPAVACLFQRCHLFHSCLSLWSPTAVLSFLVTSLLYRHPSPATPTL